MISGHICTTVNLMAIILGYTGRLANIFHRKREQKKNILILKIFNAAFRVFIGLLYLFFNDSNISFD